MGNPGGDFRLVGSQRGRTLRGVNESGRAKLYLNRPKPVMHKENIGLGLGLVVGFFSEKKLRPTKNIKGLKAF